MIFNRTTSLYFNYFCLIIKSIYTKIFATFYCIMTFYRLPLFETITLIREWGKFIKLTFIIFISYDLFFNLLPYKFKVVFICFKFSF